MTDLQIKAWENLSWVIFAMFMQRNGVAPFNVLWEIDLLKSIGFNPNMSEAEMKEAYFPKVRTGSHMRLCRKDRLNIIFTYQNACNHASIQIFEMEMSESELKATAGLKQYNSIVINKQVQ